MKFPFHLWNHKALVCSQPPTEVNKVGCKDNTTEAQRGLHVGCRDAHEGSVKQFFIGKEPIQNWQGSHFVSKTNTRWTGSVLQVHHEKAYLVQNRMVYEIYKKQAKFELARSDTYF